MHVLRILPVLAVCFTVLAGTAGAAVLRGVLADTAQYTLWFAVPEEKVRPAASAPSSAPEVPVLRAAANEYEALQLVLRPKVALHNVTVACGSPTGVTGALPPPEVRRVGFVNVTVNTYANYTPDPAQWLGPVPDPLPAYAPQDAAPDTNHPYWITWYVPPDAMHGGYLAPVTLDAEELEPATYDVRILVWRFVLPTETHLATALDSGHFASRYDDNPNDATPAYSIYDFHAVSSTADRDRLVKLYYDDYARHRLSPYNFGHGHGISALWDRDNERYVFNFTAFDARLEPYLDQSGFPRFMIQHGHDMASFRVNYLGGGSQTFRQAVPEELPGYDRFTVAYWTGVVDHLRQRGWLEQAYIMLDEPDVVDYPLVRHFTDLIFNQVTPELKVGPALWLNAPNNVDKGLEGGINLWIPLNDERWSNYEQAYLDGRAALGEEIWWYYITTENFLIDAPGICHRTWAWKAWKFNIRGLLTWAGLIWDTHAYTASWNPQGATNYNNPWRTPASPWGNGVIAFYYPPNPVGPASAPTFELVPSLRWEIMRDSMEDYEYFYLLRQLIEEAKARGRNWQPAQSALTNAVNLVTSKTRTTYDAAALRDARDAVGRQIEQLVNVSTMELR